MRERETEQGRETAAQVARNEELELTELHPPSTMAELTVITAGFSCLKDSPVQLHFNGSSEETLVKKEKEGERRKQERKDVA